MTDVLPRMAGFAVAALTGDVANNGRLRPVTLLDGAVLSGRAGPVGYMAATVEPRFMLFTRVNSASFAMAVHVWPNQLHYGQRAMVAAKPSRLAQDGTRVQIKPRMGDASRSSRSR